MRQRSHKGHFQTKQVSILFNVTNLSNLNLMRNLHGTFLGWTSIAQVP